MISTMKDFLTMDEKTKKIINDQEDFPIEYCVFCGEETYRQKNFCFSCQRSMNKINRLLKKNK